MPSTLASPQPTARSGLYPSIAQAAQSADGFSELKLSVSGQPHLLVSNGVSGRQELWQYALNTKQMVRLSPPGWDIASRVNGYGGGSYALLGDNPVVVARADQSLYTLQSGVARLFFQRAGCAYGGLVPDPSRHRVIAVEEDGQGAQALQRLVAISQHGRQVLAEGADFFGAPALSPDNHAIAWVEWSLPDMPWQHSRLCLGYFKSDGSVQRHPWISQAGAVTQPQFSADGRLICMSDRSGYWQPWEVQGDQWRCLSNLAFDHATTPWQLGECQHAWWPGGGATIRLRDGWGSLESATPDNPWRLPGIGRVSAVSADHAAVYALTQGPDHSTRLIRCDHQGNLVATLAEAGNACTTTLPIRYSAQVGLHLQEAVSAFVYPSHFCAPAALIMRIHGGPTSASYPVYDPLIAWWQSLGYAVADLNPRGSANQGRRFRERLAGEWGYLDVEDALAMANQLVFEGVADPNRLFVRGQSAGGFSVLNILASSQRFRAGTSLYGVTDAARLATLTHRFESGYLDWLIGDDLAKQAASPINRLGKHATPPILFLQGAKDNVVVASQTFEMARRLKQQGNKTDVILFADEGHGIRHPANRRHMIQREAAFYAQQGVSPT